MGATGAVPDATTSNTGALTGGASLHAVLADGDDATYVVFDNGEYGIVSFGTPSPAVPAGAVVTSMALLTRASLNSGPLTIFTTVLASGASNSPQSRILTSPTLDWVSASPLVGDYDPDTAEATVVSVNSGATKLTTLYLVVNYVAKPVVDVTAPTGTLTEDNRPVVTWENTLDADGGDQFAAAVRIFSSAQYGAGGFDPDTSDAVASTNFYGAETSWESDVVLPDGSYRAYVSVSQFSNTSDWAYEAFTVSVDRPGVPTLTVTEQPSGDPVPRVKLTLGATSGDATTDAFQVQRESDDGWIDVRTLADGIENDSGAVVYDFEAPYGEALSYRARAVHEYSETTVYSDWVEVAGLLEPTSWSIHHPTDPTLSINVELRSFPSQDRAARVSLKQPMGRTKPVPIYDTRGSETGTIVVRCPDDETRDAVKALASANVPLLFTPPPGHHEPQRWLALQDETVSRLVDHSWIDERDASYSWTEVGRPSGSITEWPSEDPDPDTDLIFL